MSALSDLVHIKDSERTALQNAVIAYDHRSQEAAAELAALNARVKTAEENWHKNEARVAKLKLAIINALNPGEPKALEILEAALKGAE